jgi:uncharacterized protein YcbX
MEINPVIDRITIYPVKSLDGVSVQKAKIGHGGCLEHDREYAICKKDGKYVKGKNSDLVYLLRSSVDFENEIISFRQDSGDTWNSFHLQKDKTAIDTFLSSFFEMPVTLQKDSTGKFLDVPVLSGMTVLSTASLKTVAGWFNDMDIEETRKRFRATIEITQVPAFWEDQLFLEEGSSIEFKIDDTTLFGISPRARCIVPSRHPVTGDIMQGFQKLFVTQRTINLPEGSALESYGHTYYLSVDCYIPPSEFGKWITVGDKLTIIGKKQITDLTLL